MRTRIRLSAEHGQSAVEFALTLPLVALLVLVLYAGGKALFYWNNATQVANEGARLVVVNAGPTFPGGLTFEQYLQRHSWKTGSETINVRMDLEDVPLAGGDFIPAGKPGSAATVYICRTYDMPFFIPDLQIRGKATMRVERSVTHLSESGTC